jgi:hypothetical protein
VEFRTKIGEESNILFQVTHARKPLDRVPGGSDHMVANADEVFKTRTIRHVPAEERWNEELVDAVTVTP